jgi:diguanylate cyclase (GGDEF)-like protein
MSAASCCRGGIGGRFQVGKDADERPAYAKLSDYFQRPRVFRHRHRSQMMVSSPPPTDIAYAMNAVMQGVFCGMWLLGSRVFGDARRAALHWSAFAGFSTLSYGAAIVAQHQPVPMAAEYLRALANLSGVAAMLALHRGVRLFIGTRLPTVAHALAFVIVLVVSWLGLTNAALRVSVIAAVLAVIALALAADLYRYGRDVVRQRHASLLAVPLVVAAAGFSLRAVRALFRAQSVTPEMITDSTANLVSALTFMVIALTFHATLMGLVFGRIVLDLRYRSRHDGLTGLLNRPALEEALLAQMQRSRRTGEPFTVLMLDLDHFKTINDRHGHAAGDRVLKHTAAALKAELREVDAVGRFGGEEFLVLMPGATVETAMPVAERLRRALVTGAPRVEGATLLCPASIGIAQWREPAEEPSRLLRRADSALYSAKVRGRDRVAVDPADAESIARLATARP